MEKKSMKSLIHFIIGFAIMIGFRFVPVGVLPEVTAVGLQVLGVFIGTIYLWTTVDPILGSITSMVMLGFTDWAAMNYVLLQGFGNAVLVQCLFLMIIMGGLTDRKINAYIARFILTRKMIEGKPWVFTGAIVFGSYLMSVFVGCFAPIFLFWPVLTSVYEDVGFKKTDLYPKLMTIMVVMAALVGFPVPPYMGNGLALIGFWQGIVGNAMQNGAQIAGATINTGTYFVSLLILGGILLLVLILLMKFVFKPDVRPLEMVNTEMLNKNPLPPMDFAQKAYSVVYVIMILCMLLPTLIPGVPFLQFLQTNTYGIGLVITVILLVIRHNGEPLLRFNPVMATKINWGTYFIIAAALIIGTALTSSPIEGTTQATGITEFLNAILSPIFSGMSGTMFTVVILLAAVVLTNICNSLVIGMILQPVILSYCATSGAAAAPIITLLIFTVLLSAAITPAASPFAAMMFGNKEFLTNGDIYKYCTIMVVAEFVIIAVIGIPFISIVM